MEYTIHFLEQHRDLLLSESAEHKQFTTSKYVAKWQKSIHKAAANRKLAEVDELNKAIKILKSNEAPTSAVSRSGRA